MSESTCGVAEHPEHCLCDVHITEPVDVNCSLSDNWVLAMVADYFDLSLPFDNDKFGFLLQNASTYLDAYYKQVIVVGTQIGDILDGLIPSKQWALIRQTYAQHAQPTVAETLDVLGISYDKLLEGLSNNRRTVEDFPIETMEEFARDLRDGTLGNNVMARKYNMDVHKGMGGFLKSVYRKEETSETV